MMNRRELIALPLAAAGALGPAGLVLAQGFAEGRDFVRLGTPVATTPGKVDVLEFFWYGCPHCNTFEPMLEAWVRTLPADVAFRRVAVGFTALHETHSRLFYTLEALGLVEPLHKKVFAAIHVQRRRLDKDADIQAFATENGVDGARFMETFKSFGVAGKARQAKSLTDGYKIDGVPALGVHGRFYTSGALAGGNQRALAVTEFLIDRARKGA
jgi:thiol:disulfide interchange protein DsbA